MKYLSGRKNGAWMIHRIGDMIEHKEFSGVVSIINFNGDEVECSKSNGHRFIMKLHWIDQKFINLSAIARQKTFNTEIKEIVDEMA